jgi:isoleucyl-tRNA synthetase
MEILKMSRKIDLAKAKRISISRSKDKVLDKAQPVHTSLLFSCPFPSLIKFDAFIFKAIGVNMYRAVDTKEKPGDLERRVRQYWDEHDIEAESIRIREGAPRRVFFEGPPTANGMPGIHHVISRTLKDVYCRFSTMRGFQVKRKAGWDTHGLPVEIEVEKILNLKDKKAIEEYGVEAFNKKCRESVFTYEKEWRELTRTMGYWLDLDHPYITLQTEYVESVWYLLNQFWSKGMIYRAHKIVPFCPSCGTPLSSHEVAQGYQETEDPSVFVKFRAKDEADTFFLAWTTTPWTLISNVALAVNADETYVKAAHNGEFLILAKKLLKVLDGEYKIVGEFTGKSLERRAYEPLYRFVEPDKPAWYVVCADYVSMDDGTGIVHTAPAFGQDDYSTGQRYGLPVVQPVDEAGKFTAEVTPWAGVFVKAADKEIIRELKERGLLYKRMQIMHSYPFCWRCKSPLIYYARTSWYIRTTDYKDKMIEQNAQVQWTPSFVGEKRFGEWLINNVDWALSRDRFWGTPLPIWVCPDCGTQDSAGSIAELREKGRMADGSPVPADIDPHRPYIDNVRMTCPRCGGVMQRTPEVIDCWFDSGAMPFAQWHYPFENADRFESELFPADFICEGIDQTRGWFYSLLAISVFLTGRAPYKRVLVNDLILDKNGKKMSKSVGNTVDPMRLMEQYGADACRWYMLAVSPAYLPTKFDEKGLEEVVSKFLGTLKNVYSFYVTYANIDGFEADSDGFRPTSELDRWMLSRLNTVIREVTAQTEALEYTRAVRIVQDFVIDDLSNWYVRRSRRRYWETTLTRDKRDAYLALHKALATVSRLMAPFAPFLAEEIHLNLCGGTSVHLSEFPTCDETLIDETLELEMKTVIDVVVLGRAARNEAGVKVRQPLSTLHAPVELKPYLKGKEDLVLDELNVKHIAYVDARDNLVSYVVKPNFKTLGPKVGKAMKAVQEALVRMDPAHLREAFLKKEPFYLEIQGHSYRIDEEDLFFTIAEREGFDFQMDKGIYVALETKLTPELLAEGYARELVNKIQFTRKESDFAIMDRITVNWCGDDELAAVFELHGEHIRSETLADSLTRRPEPTPGMKEWELNDRVIKLEVKRV